MFTFEIPQRKTTAIIPQCKKPQEKLPKPIRREIYLKRKKIQKCNFTIEELRAEEQKANNLYIYSVENKISKSVYWLIIREAFGQEADMRETTTINYQQSKDEAVRRCLKREMCQNCNLGGEE